jgi:hypothetical protein
MLFKRVGAASADAVAADAYRALMSGKIVRVHGVLNALGTLGVRLTPRSWIARLTSWLNSK